MCYIIYITDVTNRKGDVMYIQLDFESDIPIYEQLKNEIIIGIAKKQLLPGERLPSVRVLAGDIGINLHTVNKAYNQLKNEGFLLRSEEHTSELQSRGHLVCRLLLEKTNHYKPENYQ